MTNDTRAITSDTEIAVRRDALAQAEHSGEMEGRHARRELTRTNSSPALEHDTD